MTTLSPRARLKLDALRNVGDRIRHLHSMVERHVATRDPKEAEALGMPLKRELGRFKRDLTTQGFDALALQVGNMLMIAGRSGSMRHKARMLREGVANLRALADQEQRKLLTKERAEPGPAERTAVEPPDPETSNE
jgi:hypothetical protein